MNRSTGISPGNTVFLYFLRVLALTLLLCLPWQQAVSAASAEAVPPGTASSEAASPGETVSAEEDSLKGLLQTWENKTSGQTGGTGSTETGSPDTGPETETETEPPFNTAVQLTEEDIIQMNNGDCALLYSDEGYLTFLRGRFSEEKVSDYEDGIASIIPIASMLGISKGSEFYAVYGGKDRAGYTYYVYQQRYGDITIQNAVLKILVDPDGYTAGLMSSFTPNVGIPPKDEWSISAEEACRIALENVGDESLHVFEEYTKQTSVTINGVAYHAWAVFTDMPASYAGKDDRHYMEHLVAYEGSYLFNMPVDSPEELVLGDEAQTQTALGWFADKMPDTWTGTVTLHDGTTEEITVPVAYDEEGNWYLADTSRHILVADCYSFIYENRIDPRTSGENGGWPEHYLIVYDRLIRVYDFFAQYGVVSTDGLGAPILLMTDYCNQRRQSVDNACFMGYNKGWSTFGFSESNNFGESIDVVGHEYTHGITRYSVAGRCSLGEAGAINEGLSDIIGNLCEMLMGATDDETWLMGEQCGEVVRCLSFPWLKKQPVHRDGTFYVDTSDTTEQNDYGGAHTNCSMITYPAWLMAAQGMDPEEEMLLWLEAICMLTPECTFRDVHHALEFAAEIRGMDVLWIGKIRMIFEQMGVS